MLYSRHIHSAAMQVMRELELVESAVYGFYDDDELFIMCTWTQCTVIMEMPRNVNRILQMKPSDDSWTEKLRTMLISHSSRIL